MKLSVFDFCVQIYQLCLNVFRKISVSFQPFIILGIFDELLGLVDIMKLVQILDQHGFLRGEIRLKRVLNRHQSLEQRLIFLQLLIKTCFDLGHLHIWHHDEENNHGSYHDRQSNLGPFL